MSLKRPSVTKRRSEAAILALCAGAVAAGPAVAGGLTAYEIGTADVGLASAGYGARAQDASTVLTNPAGMTRLDGAQVLAAGQVLWGSTKFSVDSGTSPLLGSGDGGYAVGSGGWFLGGGPFMSHSLSPDLKLGFAVAGNFGAPLSYDDNWAGRYYVQKGTLLGISLLPAIAYRVTDKLSMGASLNAMYGVYKNEVAINNVGYPDGQLKLDDKSWGWGGNLGLLYEIDAGTRVGLTWNSQVSLDFKAPLQFSGLSPGLTALLADRGLLSSQLKLGIKVPQQVMASLFKQVNDRWAVLGSVGWQQWSKFGQVELGIDNTADPKSVTTSLNFKDTWHVALGAQYHVNDPWTLNFGIAYDSGLQDSSNVSPLLPVNSAWRFGIGGQQQLTKTTYWGIAAEYLYGGTLDTKLQSSVPVALGGRGTLDGSYHNTGTVFLAAYYNWQF